jgi:hypothetical protein
MPSDTPHSPDDPIWGKNPAARTDQKDRGGLYVVSDHPFVLRPASLRDAVAIPPRPWLFGTILLRGFVSVLVAPGGTGKSLYAMAAGLSLAIGRELLGEHVFERANTAYVNLEDPLDELDRRLAAHQIHYSIGNHELDGRFFMNSADDSQLTIAKISEDGADIIYPDIERVIGEVRAHDIGLLIVDPFAESHDLEENSNPQMVRAAKAWRIVARATGCAILLLHHVRKGPVDSIDAARGAKALTDSARVGLLMSAMTEDEALELGLREDEAYQYVRLDNAKANMAPRASKAAWFQLKQVPLGNATERYPHGDKVAVIVPWQPSSTFGDLTVIQCNEALDAIAEGPAKGVRYCAQRRGRDNSRWAGQVLIDLFNVTEQRASAMIRTWLRNGVLTETTYHDSEQRKNRKGLAVNDAKRPGTET